VVNRSLEQEIAERKQAQEALRQSEEWLRSLIENAPDMIAVIDADSTIRYGSPSLYRLLEYAPADLLGKPAFHFVHPDDLSRVSATLTQVLQAPGSHQSAEFRLRNGGGRWLTLEGTGQSVRDASGRMTVVVNARDISERKNAEEATRLSEKRYRGLFETSRDGLAFASLEGRIEEANAAYLDMLGYTLEEIRGMTYQQLTPARWASLDARIVEQVLARGYSDECEKEYIRKDGTVIPISLKVWLAQEEEGRPMRMLGVARDITERKRVEMAAARMEHMALLGQLLGGIAHELKNPLFVLTGSMQLLQEQVVAKKYDGLKTNLDRIEGAGKRMAQTVHQFLTLARPTPPARERCSVQVLLQQMLDFLRHELLKNQIRLESAISPDLPAIESTPRLLQDIFLNPIMNAIQAMHDAHGQGTLRVKARLITDMGTRGHGDAERGRGGDTETRGRGDGERWIEVRIQDDGPGIAPEHRAKLFDPFFTTKPPGVGTGLGLWSVRTNLVALGGTITCESEVGQGATFIIRLPVLR
nr:PAS domain S-box protein [Nitrospirota bacterium]